MGQVQDAGAHLRDRPVGRDVRQADDQRRDGRVDLDVDDDLGHAQDLEWHRQRRRGVRRAGILVAPEVAGQSVRAVAGTPRKRAARPGRRPMAERVAAIDRIAERAIPEGPGLGRCRRVRVGRRGPPTPGPRGREWLRRRRTHARTRPPAARPPSHCRCRAGGGRRTGRSRAAHRGSDPAWRRVARNGSSRRRACATVRDSVPASGTPGRHRSRSSRRC